MTDQQAPNTQPQNGNGQPGAAIQKQTASTELFAGAADWGTAQRIATALAASSLVPKEYQGSIPNVLIAMEISNRVRASVFSVMQSLDIIHGRPSWRAQFLIATVNACGRFTPLRFRWQGKRGQMEWGCYAVAKDREDNEECVGALITMQLAHDEGWSTKQGSKWKTIPEQMLMYRAAAFWTRVYAPELSLGMHTADEVEDVLTAQAIPIPSSIQPGNTSTLEAKLMEQKPAEVVDAQAEEAVKNLEREAMETKVDSETGELFVDEKPSKGKR